MSKVYTTEFPFDEMRKHTGDYYDSQTEMARAGFKVSQMWSIVEAEDDDGAMYYYYGPVHHYVNLIGYVATNEHHDGETVYECCIRTAEEVAEAYEDEEA